MMLQPTTVSVGEAFAARFNQVGIIIIIIITKEGGFDVDGDKRKLNSGAPEAVVLGLTTTQKLLENEAEIIKLVNSCRTNDDEHFIHQIMEHFSVDARDNMNHVEGIDENNERFYDSLGLFTAAERALLLQSMVNSVPVLGATDDSSRKPRRRSILKKCFKAGDAKSELL